jgi:cytochrome c-type biogenesis protein CcmH
MLLWLACAVLTAAVLAALLRPLWRPVARPDGAAELASVAVYRDQLSEIDIDQARGIIDAQEADLARREISRRLLAQSDAAVRDSAAVGPDEPRLASTVALAVAAVVPAATLALYLTLGSPAVPSRPYAEIAKAAPQNSDVAILIQRVEARLAQHPEDGQGWDAIAPVYFKLERYSEAAHAYAQAGRLLGETTVRLAGFAESSVLAQNGIVGEGARVAYEKILAKEPSRIEPQFWLALAKEQDGKLAEALASYRGLLARAEPAAVWRQTVEERIAIVLGRLGQSPAAGRGPSAEDVKAASGMSAADRDAMIASMVSGLADRLKANGRDAVGWQRLVQAYVVLGRRDDALKALAEARAKMQDDAAALSGLAELAKTLGLGS